MNTQFEAHHAATHTKALHAFRRRRQLKRLRSAAQLLAILAMGAYWFDFRQPFKESLVASAPPSVPAAPLVAPSEPHPLTRTQGASIGAKS